jgi:signal transduction histidine kinase
MAEQHAKQGTPDEAAGGGLYRLALRLGPLLEPQEAVAGALEACAALVAADAGLLLADGMPPAALGVPVPGSEAASTILCAPLVRAAADLIGVSVLPEGAAPLPGMAVAAALPGPRGRQGVLLLSRSAGPGFDREARSALATALPLVGQTLSRSRRHTELRGSEIARNGAVGRLAHDIRSPLVAAHASIEVVQRLLRHQQVPAPVFAALATGLRSVQTAVELCGDLLEVSRLQGGFTISPQAVPLARLLEETVQMLQPVAAQRAIALEANRPEAELQAVGDERLLRRMLTNLVSNGLRFAPHGGVVHVEALRGSQPGSVQLRVSDNGPGILPEDRERIFVPFMQGRGESSRGTGLGLALCREIAQAHGGQIWVEARPGGGTVFAVRLPAVV